MRADSRPKRMILFSWNGMNSQLTSDWPDLYEKSEGLRAVAGQLRMKKL